MRTLHWKIGTSGNIKDFGDDRDNTQVTLHGSGYDHDHMATGNLDLDAATSGNTAAC